MQVCDSVIKKETMFDQSHIEEHTAAVIEEVLKRLADQRKPFKYVGEERIPTRESYQQFSLT